MSTDERVVALFTAANPVTDPDQLDPIEPVDHLDQLAGWDVVLVDLEPERPVSTRPVRPRLVPLGATAAAFVAVVGLGVWLYEDRRADDAVSDTESTIPNVDPIMLFAPPADVAGLVVTAATRGESVAGIVRGAVETPSGEIIGVTIHGQMTGSGYGGPMTIAGRQIGVGRPIVDEETMRLADFWQYWEGTDCFSIDVTTSDGLGRPLPTTPDTAFPTPSPDIETFFQDLTITDGFPEDTVSIRIPAGWESLGAAEVSKRYVLQFTADVDTQHDVEFELEQRPATGVGVFLAAPGRTHPRRITLSGRPAWLMSEAEGWTTLVFHDANTAVALRARGVNEEQLARFGATLERRPWRETAALLTATDPSQTPVEEQLPPRTAPVPAFCDVSLELVDDAAATTAGDSPFRDRYGHPYGVDPWAPFPPAGPLAEANYRMVWNGQVAHLSLPTSGWISDGESTISKGGATLRLLSEPPRGVYADPCAHVKGPAIHSSAADLAAAVAAIPGTELVSGPSDYPFDEFGPSPAKHVVIAVPADAPCGPADGGFMLWYDASGAGRPATQVGATITVWIVDAEGHVYWAESETSPSTDPEIEEEITQILQSGFTAYRMFPEAGPLAPGEYSWIPKPTMPTPIYPFNISTAGWRSGGYKDVPGGGGSIEKGTPGTPDGAIITFWRPDRVYADPCGHTLLNAEPDLSELDTAVAAIPGTELLSGPTGDSGRQVFVLRIAEDIACDPHHFYLWAAGEHPRVATAPGSTITITIIDPPNIDGPPIFVEAETYHGASPELQREVQQIIDSFETNGGGGIG